MLILKGKFEEAILEHDFFFLRNSQIKAIKLQAAVLLMLMQILDFKFRLKLSVGCFKYRLLLVGVSIKAGCLNQSW